MNATESDLLGFLIRANDAQTDKNVEAEIKENLSAAQKVHKLRRLIEPLESIREQEETPDHLYLKTISFVAAHIAAEEIERRESEANLRPALTYSNNSSTLTRSLIFPSQDGATGSTMQRRSWFAGLGLAVALLLILIPAIGSVRAQYRIQSCQNTLREVHSSLLEYADTHDHKFPLMDTADPDKHLIKQLQHAAILPDSYVKGCDPEGGKFDYAYSIGYSQNGDTKSLRLDDGEHIPLLADIYDSSLNTAKNHKHGQNVLFIGGNVEFCKTPYLFVGSEVPDNIYFNRLNQLMPGLDRFDSVLVPSEELP
ncbi:hypothetical protein KIH39_12350 [Telmatocola sphagniphila]|uniref:Uncharacterized protein n=1 Tax=Telmatocola sphagniphila TaxID=1123043 RepID=A0A8E6EX35_9BACT|nr:hypothetical protein [Telmatocola sphagniphila]QVL34660.1 hypothetical protein KIH39_12350 [Telmatocola sphagniphila]